MEYATVLKIDDLPSVVEVHTSSLNVAQYIESIRDSFPDITGTLMLYRLGRDSKFEFIAQWSFPQDRN
jgi:hypothetical protein